MKFRADVYDKVFPRPVKREKVESNVETFKPSEEEEVIEQVQEEVTEEDVIEEVTEPEVESEGDAGE